MNEILKYNPITPQGKKMKMHMIYNALNSDSLTEEEKEKYKAEFKLLESEVGPVKKFTPKFEKQIINYSFQTLKERRMEWVHN